MTFGKHAVFFKRITQNEVDINYIVYDETLKFQLGNNFQILGVDYNDYTKTYLGSWDTWEKITKEEFVLVVL